MPETIPLPVLRWPCDLARPAPHRVQIFRGETVRLEALLTLYGAPVEIPAGATATLAWQSRDMGGSWYVAEASLDAERGAVWADFGPDMDAGADEYRAFLRVDSDGACYRAVAALQILPSPGAAINEIPIPPRVLDFATVEVLNAPYWTKAEADERYAYAGDIPGPSTAAPQMDGAASAGVSAAYARGDHRHPTDTTRAAVADATLNGRGFSEWTIVLEGQQTDSLFMYWNGEAWAPMSRAIVGIPKGNAESLSLSWTAGEEAAATFSASRASVEEPWEIDPPSAVYGLWFSGEGWVPFVPDSGPEEFKGDANSTELSWEDVTATRTALPGYVLGNQSEKPLADADATARALGGKQDALAFDPAPTAGSANPVTSGGVKTYVDTAVADAVGTINSALDTINGEVI